MGNGIQTTLLEVFSRGFMRRLNWQRFREGSNNERAHFCGPLRQRPRCVLSSGTVCLCGALGTVSHLPSTTQQFPGSVGFRETVSELVICQGWPDMGPTQQGCSNPSPDSPDVQSWASAWAADIHRKPRTLRRSTAMPMRYRCTGWTLAGL